MSYPLYADDLDQIDHLRAMELDRPYLRNDVDFIEKTETIKRAIR